MDLLQEIDKIRTRAIQGVSYDFAAGRDQGVVEARAVVEKAAARVRELEEENQRLRADLERGTTFVFGKTMDAFVRVTREPYHDNGPKWFVRSIGPTERHDDVTAALSRARDIAKEDTTT